MVCSRRAIQVKGLREKFDLRLTLSIRGIIPYNLEKRRGLLRGGREEIDFISLFANSTFFVNWFFAVEAVIFLNRVREKKVFLKFKIFGLAFFRGVFSVFVDPDFSF